MFRDRLLSLRLISFRWQFQLDIQNHGNLLFVNHHIGNLKHGRQVILQINHVAMATRKRHKRKITGIRQFLQYTAYSGFGESPPGAQFTVSHQRIARTIAQIDDRSHFRAFYLRIVIHGRHPQIQYDIHFRAAVCTNQFRGKGYRQKEKSSILLARCVVFQHSVMLFPTADFVFDDFTASQGEK